MEKNMPQGDPLVTIRCLVYNHEPFLRQCLDGFVMQKTTFPFEAIVHDDASTDGSAAIIREYAEKYPDIIKPIYETENQHSKHDGSLGRIMDAAMHPNAKYIAHCEGDDYWTDPNKLQLQVDFLESHPDYYMTCHAYKFYYEDTKEFKDHKFLNHLPLERFNGKDFCTPSIDDFFNSSWFTQILSIVRRNQGYVSADKLKRYDVAYDYVTCYYMLRAGKCALFKDVMGVYRKHGGGVYSGRELLSWMEQCLNNYYVLYRLENEKCAVKRINDQFVDICYSSICKRDCRKAFKLLRMHIGIMPIKESSHSILRVLSLGIKSLKTRLMHC